MKTPLEFLKVFCSKTEILNLYSFKTGKNIRKNISEIGKIFSKAIDKAEQWVYNDTVIIKFLIIRGI